MVSHFDIESALMKLGPAEKQLVFDMRECLLIQ